MRNIAFLVTLLMLVGMAGAAVTYTQPVIFKDITATGTFTGPITGTASRIAVGSFIDTSYGLLNYTTNKARINLTANGGLKFGTGADGGSLGIYAGDGLDTGASGLAVDVTDFIDTSYGLTENSNDVRVNIASNKGLEFGSGALQAKAGDGIVLGASGIAVNLTTNGGLQIGSGADGGSIGVKVGNGIETGASGIAVKSADPTIDVGSSGVSLGSGQIITTVLAGGSPGDLTLTGIAVGDELLSVIRFDVASDTGTEATGDKVQAISDIKTEFTVGANKISNGSGTDTSGDSLFVMYLDRTA